MTVHDFHRSLQLSKAYADAPWWLDVYRKAFGSSLQSIVNIREDGWAQRGGIDRLLIFRSGKTLNSDEKVRTKDYGDILLEEWSNYERKTHGWAMRESATDVISYAIVPPQRCFLFPFPTLRKAFMENRLSWAKTFGRRVAQNRGYRTVSIPVPIDVLMNAISAAMVVSWEAEDA